MSFAFRSSYLTSSPLKATGRLEFPQALPTNTVTSSFCCFIKCAKVVGDLAQEVLQRLHSKSHSAGGPQKPGCSLSLRTIGHKLSCFNDPNTCFSTDLRGYVEEVLLASRKPEFYCAVTLGLLLLGFFSLWLGLLSFVAQMFGSGAVILTLLYSWRRRASRHDLGSNGIGVGWSCGNALVGDFHVDFLACFHRFADGTELRFRLFVDRLLRTWSGRVPGPLAPHSD